MPQEIETEEEIGSGVDGYADLNGRLEHSRIAGEYYRDLSANYGFYEQQAELYKLTAGEEGQRWPTHPFPNESYANSLY